MKKDVNKCEDDCMEEVRCFTFFWIISQTVNTLESDASNTPLFLEFLKNEFFGFDGSEWINNPS